MPPPMDTSTPSPVPSPTGASQLGNLEPVILTLAIGITSGFAFLILVCLFKARRTWRTINQDPRASGNLLMPSRSPPRSKQSSSARLYAAYTPRSISSSGSGLSFSARTVVSPHPILGERPEDVQVHKLRQGASKSSMPRKQASLAAQSPSSALVLVDPDATMTDADATAAAIGSKQGTTTGSRMGTKLSRSFSSGQKPPKSASSLASSASQGNDSLLSKSLPASITKGILTDTQMALRAARNKSTSSSGSMGSCELPSSRCSGSESVLVITPAGSLEITLDQAQIPPAPDNGPAGTVNKRKGLGARGISSSSLVGQCSSTNSAPFAKDAVLESNKFLIVPDPLQSAKVLTASCRARSPTDVSAMHGAGDHMQKVLAHYRKALEGCLGKQEYASIWQPAETVWINVESPVANDGFRTVCKGKLGTATQVVVYCYDALVSSKLKTTSSSPTEVGARHASGSSSRARQRSASPIGSKPPVPSPLALTMSMGDIDSDEAGSSAVEDASKAAADRGTDLRETPWSERQIVELWVSEIRLLRSLKDCPYILPLLGISLQPSLSTGGHIYHLTFTPCARPLADLVFGQPSFSKCTTTPTVSWYDDDAATILYQVALGLSYVHARGLKGHGALSILDVHLLPTRLPPSGPSSGQPTTTSSTTALTDRAVIGGFGVGVHHAVRRALALTTGADRPRGHAYARYIDPGTVRVSGTASVAPASGSALASPDVTSLADRYALGVLMYECVTRSPVLGNVPGPVAVIVAAAAGKRPVLDVQKLLVGARVRVAADAAGGQEMGAVEARRIRVKMMDLLTRCWNSDPARRPAWDEILQELRAIVPLHVAEGWDWR